MTTTPIATVQEHESFSSGLVESASVNSSSEFTQSKFEEQQVIGEKEINDFVNTFICHLIFFGIFCLSLVLHLLLDLGLISFMRKNFNNFIEVVRNNVLDKDPAFA